MGPRGGRSSKEWRRVARALIATYHEAELAGLVEHVAEATERYRTEELGIDHQVIVEPGKSADLVVLDGTTPYRANIHDPQQAVVYCAGSRAVRGVYVGGRQVVHAGEVVTRRRKGGRGAIKTACSSAS